MIHACENGCVLFRNDLNDAQVCLICGQSRYKVGRNKMTKKILKHFPFIPRLKRVFGVPNLSKLMSWHVVNTSHDGLVRHAHDSNAWAHIDETQLEFAIDPRNLRLVIELDGVNPFNNQSNNQSTWPIFMLHYNLLPWLTTKMFFLMLVLLIPSKESIKNNNVDVYLAPLVEELW